VTGDVVNTAARLQQHAPVGGIVVGETTYRATRDLFEYERLDSVTAKGKAEPVALWQVRAARRRFGVDVEPIAQTPLIGRDDDLALLQSIYTRTLPRRIDAASDDHRRARRRQDATNGRVQKMGRRPAGARLLATGALASIRRGDHILGTR
jgi:hypothetical protein